MSPTDAVCDVRTVRSSPAWSSPGRQRKLRSSQPWDPGRLCCIMKCVVLLELLLRFSLMVGAGDVVYPGRDTASSDVGRTGVDYRVPNTTSGLHGPPKDMVLNATSPFPEIQRRRGILVFRRIEKAGHVPSNKTDASRSKHSELNAEDRMGATDLEPSPSVTREITWPLMKTKQQERMLGDRPFNVHHSLEAPDRIIVPIRLNPGERLMTPQEVADWVARGGLVDFESELVRAGEVAQKAQVFRPQPPRLVRLPAAKPTMNGPFGFPRLRPPQMSPPSGISRPFQDSVKVVDIPRRPHRRPVVMLQPLQSSEETPHGDYLDRRRNPLPLPSGVGSGSEPAVVRLRPEPTHQIEWMPRLPDPHPRRPQHSSVSQGSLPRVTTVPTSTSASFTTPRKPTTTVGEYEYVEYEVEDENGATTSRPPRPRPGSSVNFGNETTMTVTHDAMTTELPTPQPSFGTRLFPSELENRPHSPQYVTEADLWKEEMLRSSSKAAGRMGNGSFVVRSPVELSPDAFAGTDKSGIIGGRDTSVDSSEDDHGTNDESRFRLTTVNLAYILIGSCTAVSIACLAIVAVSLRCRAANHRKNLRHLARDIEARRRWHRRIQQFNGTQQATAKEQKTHSSDAHGTAGISHSTCSSSGSCSTLQCCCGTWTLGAKNLDSRALTSSSLRNGPRRLPFGAASSLHCKALGPDSPGGKSSSSEDDSLDARSWGDDCSSCAPRCTCVTAAIVHDWNLTPANQDTSRQSTAVLPQVVPGKKNKPPPPPPPPKPSKPQCPKCRTSSRRDGLRPALPSDVADGKGSKDGSVFWSSNDERLI